MTTTIPAAAPTAAAATATPAAPAHGPGRHPGRLRRVLATRQVRLAARLLAGAAVLVAVIGHVGAGPFLHGLVSIDARAIAAALVLTAAATAAAAWRWAVIARRLGASLPWRTAVAAYYRSQFLNSVLPGGVIGDVDRALAQGRRAGGIAEAARAVVIERTVGQLVQLVLTVAVLAFLGRDFEGYILAALGIGVAVLALAMAAAASVSIRARTVLRRERDELAAGVGSLGAAVQLAVSSIIVVGCHVATFAVAATAVGAEVPAPRLLALAFVVLLAAAIPFNVGGWGPREGVAAWAFALAGAGAADGVATATLFGVLALISVAPGAVVVATAAARRRTPALPLAGSQRKAHS